MGRRSIRFCVLGPATLEQLVDARVPLQALWHRDADGSIRRYVPAMHAVWGAHVFVVDMDGLAERLREAGVRAWPWRLPVRLPRPAWP